MRISIWKLIPLVPWWLIYNLLNLHTKEFDTRTLGGWRWGGPYTKFTYASGVLFWIVFLALGALLLRR